MNKAFLVYCPPSPSSSPDKEAVSRCGRSVCQHLPGTQGLNGEQARARRLATAGLGNTVFIEHQGHDVTCSAKVDVLAFIGGFGPFCSCLETAKKMAEIR